MEEGTKIRHHPKRNLQSVLCLELLFRISFMFLVGYGEVILYVMGEKRFLARPVGFVLLSGRIAISVILFQRA